MTRTWWCKLVAGTGPALVLLIAPTLVRPQVAGSGDARAGAPHAALTHAPISWLLSAKQIHDTCAAAVQRATAVLERVDAHPGAATPFATTILPVERASGELENATQPMIAMEDVSPDSAVRDAAAACDQSASAFGVKAGADPVVYHAAVAAAKSGEAKTAAEKQLVEAYVEAGRYSGAGLDSATRRHAMALQNRLNDVQREYGLALAADSTTVVLTRPQLRGLPPRLVAAFKATSDGNSYVVPVNESTVGAFYANAQDPIARRTFYYAFANRGGATTLGKLRVALMLRDTLARLMGAPDWASYQLTLKMAKSPARVDTFLSDLDARLLPKARTELAELAQAKRAAGDTTPLTPWDIPFEQNVVRTTRYAVSDSIVSRYFPVDRVITGVLGIYQDVFGVRFTETGRTDAWAAGVREFSVTDSKSGAHLGWFYLDLFPRPHKYGHFATIGLRSRVVAASGRVTEPVAAVVGNWPKPTAGTPSLLSHQDVITFFHEFGHVMADLLNESPYATTGAFRQDFVEAPSQALEFWAWSPEVIRRVSADYETGKPMPDSLLTRMLALKHFDEGLSWTGQIMLAAFDMRLHSTSPGINIDSLWAGLKASLTVVPWMPGTSPASSFGHLMAGYDAGYYGYLWSRVYAADIFSRFEREGVLNPTVGAAYRMDVLAPAGTIEPDVAVQRLLGRPVNDSAFLRDIGVSGSAPATGRSRGPGGGR